MMALTKYLTLTLTLTFGSLRDKPRYDRTGSPSGLDATKKNLEGVVGKEKKDEKKKKANAGYMYTEI